MIDKNEKIAIYIDGSNLYYKLKELSILNTTNFDYLGFCDFLARGRKVISYRYYVGTVRVKDENQKSLAMRINQQRLFNNLRESGFCIKQGYLMQNDGKYHEKGVDIKIATDMLIGAYENIYDTAILISSDTDLIPAIKQIKYLKKNVEYIGFAHKPSLGLQKNVTLSRLLIEDEILNFISKNK